MRVLYIAPGAAPCEREIESSLESMQSVVGGLIEPFYPYADPIAFVCNEEGKINGMELNRAIYDDEGHMVEIMAGPFFICGLGEDFTDLPPAYMEKFKKQFQYPEKFASINGKIVAMKIMPPEPEISQSKKTAKASRNQEAR